MRRWTTAATELPRTSEAGCSLRRSVDRGRDLGLAPRMLMTREDQASYPWMHSPMKFGPQQEPRSSSEVGNLASHILTVPMPLVYVTGNSGRESPPCFKSCADEAMKPSASMRTDTAVGPSYRRRTDLPSREGYAGSVSGAPRTFRVGLGQALAVILIATTSRFSETLSDSVPTRSV